VKSVCIVLGSLAFLYTLYVTAWVGDDAYISFRVVDNFVNGFGLKWNVAERVWVYTNPLWVLVMSAFYFFSREFYFTCLAVGAGISIFALWLIATRLCKSVWQMVILFLIAIGSKAFTDYSTSGLENPLTHLLLVCFCLASIQIEKGERRFFWLCLWTALILVNRMDTVLLVAPVLLFAAFDQPLKRTLIQGLIGFLPFIVWELFALWYYGMPFPNTFYAKTHTGIEGSPLFSQSLHYFLDSFARDPITLSVIAGGLLLALTSKDRNSVLLGSGVLFSLIYTTRVGADFMSGRFFTAPLLISLIIFATENRLREFRTVTALAASLFLIALLNSTPPILSAKNYGVHPFESGIQASGIADERGWYYPSTGLRLNLDSDSICPNHKWYAEGLEEKAKGTHVYYDGCVGFLGVAAGPEIHIVDGYALTEPFYSHLPTEWRRGWRIGHFSRVPPEKYHETVLSGQNQITDTNLSRYYNKIVLLTRGDLGNIDRLKSIVLFNIGRFESRLSAYSNPIPEIVEYEKIRNPLPVNTAWNDSTTHQTRKNGLQVVFERPVNANRVEVSLDHNDDLFVIWYRGEQELGWAHLDRRFEEHGGLRYDTVQTPVAALTGYDRLDVIPCFGDDLYAVGHVRLIEQ
jgi:arabinofuranosyltransferase